jgi:hypothetical protein
MTEAKRVPGEQRGGDHSKSRPVARTSVPAIDDELRLSARGSISLELGGAGLDVEPAGPHAHLRSSVVVAGRFTTASARDRGSGRLFARVLHAPAQSSLQVSRPSMLGEEIGEGLVGQKSCMRSLASWERACQVASSI